MISLKERILVWIIMIGAVGGFVTGAALCQ